MTTEFTKYEIDTAVKVLMESKTVRNHVKGEARFFGIDLNTPEGEEFLKRESRKYALVLLKQ